MFFDSQSKDLNVLEQLLAKQDRSTQELLLRIDALDREVKGLMDELDICPKTINTYLSNPDNFSKENWEELQKQRQMLDEKLVTDIENIRNPIKQKKKQDERVIQNHWLFVR
jgi:archaellum component FlaC